MNYAKKSLFSAVLLTGLALPAASYATNGLFLPGYGAKSTGMGGVSIALRTDALAPAANPAGISGMAETLDIGAGIFNPPRRAYVDAENDPTFGSNIAEARSKRDYFLIPNIGYTDPVNEQLTFGITAFGNGLGVFYQDGLYQFGTNDGAISIDLKQLIMPFTLAYQADSNNAFGASLTFAAQIFEAKGFQSFAPVSSDSDKMTDNGADISYGGGVRLGYLYDNDDKTFSFGVYYASRVYMTEFDDYAGLFAEQGDLDIPANYGVGISYKISPKWMTAFDIEQIEWSSIASMANSGPALYTTDPIGTAVGGEGVGALGRDDGMGFGWEDQTVYKLGFKYEYSANTAFTLGFNYGKTPIPQDQLAFGVLGPAVTEKHMSIGWQQKLTGYTLFDAKEAELTVSFLHGFKEKMSGLSPLGFHLDESGNVVSGAGYAEFEMVQNQLEFGYGLKF